jgi:uncharacterized coiled-coil DUF342 family protein
MTIHAPDRNVCQYTGELADGLSFPAPFNPAAVVAKLTAERDEARAEAAGVKAELDNVMYQFRNLGENIAGLTGLMNDYHTERDDARESCDIYRDKYDAACESRDAAYVRVDELSAELDDVKGRRR